jgi:hypothetical protein
MMKKRVLAFTLVVLLVAMTLAGCNTKPNEASVTTTVAPTTTEAAAVVPAYEPLDANVEGELTIMLWSGDGSFLKDIGKKNFAPEELGGQNQAAAYAVAKAFNELYPNVKINVFAKADGPDDDNGTWAQHRENFKAENGRYPDLFAATDLPGDVAKGLVADLSIFSDDPLYQTFNDSVMRLMNFNGFQAGLPQYLLPWGVFVNRSLAEDNNLDVPNPNWTIDEYTDYISQADMKTFYGAMDTPFSFLNTGSKSISYLLSQSPTDTFVNLDSDEIRTLIDYVPKWANYSVWPQQALGNIAPEVMDENWWWGFKFFINNKILTLDGDPWMMGDAAHPAPDHWGRALADDWDIYPRPSTAFQDNTVGVVLDPFAVYNYAMEDGNPELSDAEAAKMKLAYTFAAFWAGDTRAWEARLNQQFLDGEALKTSLNDSLPLVTGDEFDKQMAIWYAAPIHARYADASLMPGFQEVLRIWEKGQFWDISDKAYPYYHDADGTRRSNLYEWENMWNPDVSGAMRTDANWADNVKARLSEWNNLTNQRFKESFEALNKGLKEFYKR